MTDLVPRRGRFPSACAFGLLLATVWGCASEPPWVPINERDRHDTASEWSSLKTKERAYDIVVYGGTSAGVAAAVQAKRMNQRVVLIAQGKHLGGMTTSGLGRTDSGNKEVIGGLSREFYQRVRAHYNDPDSWVHERPEDFPGYPNYSPSDDALWAFEPHVAEQIFETMLAEADVPVFRRERLDLNDGVSVSNGRIERIRMESGRTFRGRIFIDATYEGDLMAKAGVSYIVGREPNDTYGETLNGVQKANALNHNLVPGVDPYVVPGDPSSGLVRGVHGDDPGADGQGDHRVQAYCFRLCLTNVDVNRVPFAKPEGYDERDYELLFRNFAAGETRLPLLTAMMPNRKTDTNNFTGISLNFIGMNYAYPDADYATREAIIAAHAHYQKGLLWTLANHPRVPEPIRTQAARWGLAKDEFLENDHWPRQIYIREARRMIGSYVMTESDCRRKRMAPDPVGMGSYNMDSHNTQRYVTPEGFVRNEGNLEVSPRGAYLISYRSLVPRREEITNLLVTAAISASHAAYGSIRMEPVFMILGHAAATAAAHALEDGVAVQDVDYPKLRARLLADKARLDLPPGDLPRPDVDPATLGGIVVDDSDTAALVQGAWRSGNNLTAPGARYVAGNFLHDDNEWKGHIWARYTTTVPEAGTYEVRLSYTPHADHATNVPVTIEHAGGTTALTVNQRAAPTIDGLFISLGRYTFTPDRPAVVFIGNGNTDGIVVLDAVQWLRIE